MLYWQFSNTLNTMPWMTNTESREQSQSLPSLDGSGITYKRLLEEFKSRFLRKLKGDKKLALLLFTLPSRLQASIFKQFKRKKKSD